VERTAAHLSKHGIAALPYHAGMTDEERTSNQEAFQKDDVDVIVATIAFGMGIDKSNVRFIIHQDMPKDVESWYQEIGRAGRDGLDSDCFLFYSWADVKLQERFLSDIEDEALRETKRAPSPTSTDGGAQSSCRHQGIVAYFDEAIDPCGDACDVCRGVTVEAMAADAMMAHVAPGKALPIAGSRSTPGSAAGGGARAALDSGTLGDAPPPFDPTPTPLFDRLRALRKRARRRARRPGLRRLQ
jgi:ATP-dependent DNA helicase RecQ